MKDPAIDIEQTVRLNPDGSLVIPPEIMAEYVLETAGADLWFNRRDMAVGIRLLRGAEDPPFVIRRVEGPDGRQGVIDAAAFIESIGGRPEAEARECEARYFPKYHLIAVRIADPAAEDAGDSGGVLDDFPALED